MKMQDKKIELGIETGLCFYSVFKLKQLKHRTYKRKCSFPRIEATAYWKRAFQSIYTVSI